MQTITYEEVLEAACKAWNEGRLTVQQANSELRKCHYVVKDKGKEYCCAVGAAFNDETKAKVLTMKADTGMHFNDMGIGRLINNNIVNIPNQSDQYDIIDLQNAHDDFCRKTNDFGPVNVITEVSRKKFLELLGISDSADPATVGITSA